jgi:hypothetical protein
MDQLVLVDIINIEVEEEGYPTWLGCKISNSDNKKKTMMNSNEKEKKHRIDDIKVRNGFQ